MRVINEHADRTGKKVMYAFNITDEIDAMLRHHDDGARRRRHVRDGQPQQRRPRRRRAICAGSAQLPIHGHRNGWGMLTRASGARHRVRRLPEALAARGRRPAARQRPAEQVLRAGRSVVALDRACLTPLLGRRPAHAGGVVGQWGGQAPETYAARGHGRPDVPGRRRDHRPPGRRRGRRRRASARRGRPPLAGVPLDEYAATTPSSRQRDGDVRRDGAHDADACCSPSTATTSPARPTRWSRSRVAGVPTVLFLEPPAPEQLARPSPACGAVGVAGHGARR